MNFLPPILDGPLARTPLEVDPGALEAGAPLATEAVTRLGLFHAYMGVFIIAFLVTLFVTPLMRKLAVANGIIDRPNDPRKIHKIPVAYLGGVAVFIGMMAGIAFAILARDSELLPNVLEGHRFEQTPVPFTILLGFMLIMLAGLLDDVVGVSPRIKVSMQLIAAAALAMEDVGVKVAAGVLAPFGELIGNKDLIYTIPIPAWAPFFEPGAQLPPIDLIYWAGTAIIAVFILGACNASNLIDGLDGLCSGVTAIAAGGLLVIALGLAIEHDGKLDSARVILCLGLLGACLGFLPHNFNPATIFLGDCGSMLLGYSTIVIVLTLGDTGRTPLVVAGVLIYSLPIIDTTLAIVRRRMSGRSMSDPDDQHLHHLLKRAMGVKGACFTMYGIAASFGALGVVVSFGRARVAYAIALVLAAYIGVTAVKIARRKAIEEEATAMRPARVAGAPAARPSKAPGPARAPGPVVASASADEPQARPV